MIELDLTDDEELALMVRIYVDLIHRLGNDEMHQRLKKALDSVPERVEVLRASDALAAFKESERIR